LRTLKKLKEIEAMRDGLEEELKKLDPKKDREELRRIQIGVVIGTLDWVLGIGDIET